jgi:hypothetical protein
MGPLVAPRANGVLGKGLRSSAQMRTRTNRRRNELLLERIENESILKNQA